MKKILLICIYLIVIFFLNNCSNQLDEIETNVSINGILLSGNNHYSENDINEILTKLEQDINSGKIPSSELNITRSTGIVLEAMGPTTVHINKLVTLKATTNPGAQLYVWSLYKNDIEVKSLGITFSPDNYKQFEVSNSNFGSGIYHVECVIYIYDISTGNWLNWTLTSNKLSLNYKVGYNDYGMTPLHSSWANMEVHAVGDFNGDGMTDVYLNYPNLGNGAVQHIWYGRTGNGFDDYSMTPLHSSWANMEVHAVGDFNGDGMTDIYMNYPNLGNGAVQHIWYGRTGNGFDDYGMTPLHSSWANMEVHAVGDFNGDGMIDIYLNYPNLGNGAVQHIWYGL